MSPLYSVTVSIRRILARRPWLYTALVSLLAVGAAATVHSELERVERARASWGDVRTVLVAAEPIEPGMALIVESRGVPVALVPEGAIDDASGLVARQRIGIGEIVAATDVARGADELALVPDGWLAVPVVESTPSGATVGEQLQIVSEGIVVTTDAMMVGRIGDALLLAVRSDLAAPVAAAAEQGRITLLRVP